MTNPAPIDGFDPVTPVQTPTYRKLQIVGPGQGTQIETAISAAVDAGVIAVGHVNIKSVGYQVQINETFAGVGDFMVIGTVTDDDNTTQIVSVALYNGPDGKYDNPRYTDAFQQPAS